MGPWEVIQEALIRKRPVRNLQWLADQVGVSIQVVSNWKARGVPARRYRDIASVLGLTIDQIEGVAALPWEAEPKEVAEFSDEVRQLALDIESLPTRQRDWVLLTLREAVKLAREMVLERQGEAVASHQPEDRKIPKPPRKRKAA